MAAFSVIASLYDRINGDQYAKYVSFLQDAFASFASVPVKEVLDVGCGTGRITARMADAGYDMIGLDNSPEMLNLAMEANRGKNTLLLLQDMRRMDLYGTVQAAYCAFDGLNYLKTTADVKKALEKIYLFLEPGGVFVCDLNTGERLKRYQSATFSYEFEDGLLLWRNEAIPNGCRFLLDWFAGRDGDTYTRRSEEQEEYAHDDLRSIAEEVGFSAACVFSTGEDDPIPACVRQDSPGEHAKTVYVFVR